MNNVAIVEGHSVATVGGKFASNDVKFHVLLNKPVPKGHTITVKYTVGPKTATGGSEQAPGVDFVPIQRVTTLTFRAGEFDKSVDVRVFADTTPESNETFAFHFVSVSGGAHILKGFGIGLIVNDD